MPKPKHTFMVINGKAKVAADIQGSRGKSSEIRSEHLVNVADYVLKQAKVDASKIRSGLRILGDAKRTPREKLDNSKIAKLKEVTDCVVKLAKQVEHFKGEEKKLVADLSRYSKQIVITNIDYQSETGLSGIINTLEVFSIFLLMLLKLKAKGIR